MDALTGLEPALIGLQPTAYPSWLQRVLVPLSLFYDEQDEELILIQLALFILAMLQCILCSNGQTDDHRSTLTHILSIY